MYGNSEHVLTCLDGAQKRLLWALTIFNLHMTRAKESGACRRWRFTSTCDMIPHEMIWHDMTRYDIRWHDATWCHMAWCDVLRCDVTRRDMTWHGMTRHEMMWHDMRWYNNILELMWYDKAERPLVLWSQRLECVLWCLRLLVPQSRQIMRKRLVSFEKQRFALVREAQLGVAVETRVSAGSDSWTFDDFESTRPQRLKGMSWAPKRNTDTSPEILNCWSLPWLSAVVLHLHIFWRSRNDLEMRVSWIQNYRDPKTDLFQRNDSLVVAFLPTFEPQPDDQV